MLSSTDGEEDVGASLKQNNIIDEWCDGNPMMMSKVENDPSSSSTGKTPLAPVSTKKWTAVGGVALVVVSAVVGTVLALDGTSQEDTRSVGRSRGKAPPYVSLLWS